MGRTYPKLKRQSVQRKAARKRNRERAVPRVRVKGRPDSRLR
jgi:hypothetical protein